MMPDPIFHPALDGVAEELEAIRGDAARYGVSVVEVCACIICMTAAMLVRAGSSSEKLSEAMERSYAARAARNN